MDHDSRHAAAALERRRKLVVQDLAGWPDENDLILPEPPRNIRRGIFPLGEVSRFGGGGVLAEDAVVRDPRIGKLPAAEVDEHAAPFGQRGHRHPRFGDHLIELYVEPRQALTYERDPQ